MTRFAFGAKCGRPARPPVFGACAADVVRGRARAPRGASSDASAPMPDAARGRDRTAAGASGDRSSSRCTRHREPSVIARASLLGDRFVEIQNDAATVVQAASSAGIEALVARRLADGRAASAAACWSRRELGRAGASSSSRSTPVSSPLGARAVASRKAYARRLVVVVPAFGQRALGQRARRLHVGRIVHQHQRLQRRVGQRAAGRALLAIRRVERRPATAGGAVRFQKVYMLRR